MSREPGSDECALLGDRNVEPTLNNAARVFENNIPEYGSEVSDLRNSIPHFFPSNVH
jgi:hypothetical protein